MDGDGHFCGLEGNANFPYLYYIITKDSYSPRAVCVKECPVEITDKVDCKTTSRVPSKDTCLKEASKDGSGHIGYGTNRVLKRFCVPDIDKLPTTISPDLYNNLIGNFGLDDVQEYMEDITEAGNIYLYTFLTCIIVTVCYSLLIYYFTGLIVWVSIITTGIGLLALSLYLN